jgi:DNA-binding CsgD family transcriptional regulator/PAS domain-containing protein
MTSGESALSQLIGEIYDAAIDPALWPDVMERISRFVGGSIANLYVHDANRQGAALIHSYGQDPHYLQLYLEKYVGMNPLYPASTFIEVGEVFEGSSLVPHQEMQATRFYQEWLKPQGIVDVLVANLEKSGGSIAALAVRLTENDGPLDGATVERMELIVPHVRRAVLIGKVIDWHKLESAALSAAVDALAAAVFLLNGQGGIVHANSAGRRVLERGDMLRASNDILIANDPAVHRTLRDAFAAAQNGDAAVGAKAVAVPLTTLGGDQYVGHVLPLTSGARQLAGKVHSAAAAFFLRKPELDVPSSLEILAKLYRLTPSEVRVLQAVVDDGSVPAAAEALGLSQSTVKTHLHHVFEKTGTSSQSELVKLVAGAASPLAV